MRCMNVNGYKKGREWFTTCKVEKNYFFKIISKLSRVSDESYDVYISDLWPSSAFERHVCTAD